ncbi:MAG: AarF/UbiB family protein, partial [Hyphomicrobiales bacterium]|nr:AarF/UbiB family protein [Hyphomicrobiales bacterium]
QAMEDGFFHADMHPGNLFVEQDGTIVAVDFGIMSRLDVLERQFLAGVLHGFLQRDYRRVAELHFRLGYVPHHKSVDDFSLALRSIGEPITDKDATDISMGGLLLQLFQVTARFDMPTQPRLLLLQKTMVVVEGVARSLDPEHNMWESAKPVARRWMEKNLGLQARLSQLSDVLREAPAAMENLAQILRRMEERASPDPGGRENLFICAIIRMGGLLSIGALVGVAGWFLGRMS